jgi:Uncharacterised nucleotidyltransferase
VKEGAASNQTARPLAERQLILLSAGTAARRRAMREPAQRLAAEVDWSQLTETLRSRKLLSVLGPRILELAEGRASDSFATAVEQILEAGRRQGAFLQLITLRVIATLADAGIRCAPLKGPLLGEAIYGDLGRRLSSDIDLLVAPNDLQAAVEAVRGLGYGAPVGHIDRCGLPLLHFGQVHVRGELPSVELHWRVHWYEQSFAGECLLPATVDPLGQWRPAPACELAALLLFYARDGFIDLRLAVDLGAWWDVYGEDLPPGALGELLRVHPALARAVSVAATVAEGIVGLPAARILGDAPTLGLRDRVAVRLANPHPHASRSQLYADKGLIDALLTPRGDFGAFIRRELLPPREVRDRQAQHAGRRRARSPLGRCAGVLTRYGLAMTRLLRAPEAPL